MKAKILLIDDDPVDLKVMRALLERSDFGVESARSGKDGLALVAGGGIDMVLSDVMMPGMSGVDVAREISVSHPRLPVVLITAHADVKTAVEAMREGAFDYVRKPADETELLLTIDRALEYASLKTENALLRSELAVGGMYGERMIGQSPAMQKVFEVIGRVAVTDSTVMITGQTGTGKELAAQMIHFRSSRAAKPFIAVNCASINQGVSESELFGHEKGAFTGAASQRRGRFEEADGGTLFLDEVTEATPEFQAKLLRILQEGTLQRVGGNRDIKVDVRIIASSNRDLESEVKEGRLREDLYFRLNVVPVELPPLCERKGDAALLADHFLRAYIERYSSPVQSISKKAMAQLVKRKWPGNVRELQHAIERAVVLAGGDTLEPEDFALKDRKPDEVATLDDVVSKSTRDHVLATLESVEWRKQKAATILGIDRATLYRLIKKFGLEG